MSMEFGKLNFAVGFNRTSAFPLDANSYFETYDDAVTAAAGAAEVGSADSAYYIGQLLIVKDATVGVGLYQINAGKTLTKFGQASSADELAEKVSALETRCTTIEGKLILATSEKDGLMSSADKAKLDALETTYVQKDGDKVLSDNNYSAADKAIVDGIEGKLETEKQRAMAAEKKTADDNKAAIAKINTDLGGLTGAMHFVGTSTTDPKTGATVEGHETFKAGDVCLFGAKEYVYNGTVWIELGDEGSHATRDYVDNSVQTAKEAVEGELATAVSTLEGKITTAKSEAITEAGTAADGKIAEALKAYTTTEALSAELAKKLEAKDLNGYAKETYVDTAKSTLLGTAEDDATKETIRGARKLAQSGVDAAAAAQETANSKCTLDEVKALGYTTNVGTVTSVAAGTGLKVTGTASVTPTIEIDTAVIFELDCGSATTIIA